MATIVRGTKTTSNANSTAYANSTDPTAAEVNADFNTGVTELNGAISEANLAEGCLDLAGTKLSGVLGTGNGGSGTPVGVRLIFGAIVTSTTLAETTSYLSMYGDTDAGTESNTAFVLPFAGSAKNLFLRPKTAQGSTGTLVVTVRKNSEDTSVRVTVPASGAVITYSDKVNLADFSAGDRITLSVTNNATSGAEGVRSWSLEYVPA